MNFNNKIKEIEKLVNEIYNRPRFFAVTFKDFKKKYKYFDGSEYVYYDTLSEFKKAVNFNSEDKLMIIKLILRKNNFL